MNKNKTSSSSSSSSSSVSAIPNETKESLSQWLLKMYDVSDVSDEMIKSMYEAFSYKGFNRDDTLKQLHSVAGDDKRLFIELIIATALRGPQAASNLRFSNNKTSLEMGIPASGGRGNKRLTLNKIQASTADLAAFYLKKMNPPKRLNVDLPSWLQFPSAGSIKLPSNYRAQHIEFSKLFSKQIGGEFNSQIYDQMEVNAYLDEKLHLFQ